jgi:acyl-CoA thioesterase FadM
VAIYVDELTGRSFDLLYKITAVREGREVLIAEAKTGMLCFDYDARRIVQMSDVLKGLLTAD